MRLEEYGSINSEYVFLGVLAEVTGTAANIIP